jgi:hypothetical protein
MAAHAAIHGFPSACPRFAHFFTTLHALFRMHMHEHAQSRHRHRELIVRNPLIYF